jgi:type I restriction enzyme M protein
MGFKPEENEKDVWVKIYNDDCLIKVNFNKEHIDYGNVITLGDRTTSNFRAIENLVVLECVNRLLEKGYKPKNIILEKAYPLGHITKGKLDILILNEGKAYLMIECKTYGDEFEQALKKTLNSNKSQLLSYYQQDKSAKYLCLYTSRAINNSIEYKNNIIEITDLILKASNVKEVYERWNKNFKTNGIFESWASTYNVKVKALIKKELKPLTKDDSNKLFNQFAEILRHNVVSDKPNAFNKLITLLLCKIVDEEKRDGDELDFQRKDDDDNISLQKRLNDLYKKGMKDYLTKEVTDYSDEDIDGIVGLSGDQKKEIKKMMTHLMKMQKY